MLRAFLCACLSLPFASGCDKTDGRKTIANLIQQVDDMHLRNHVAQLTRLGPRSVDQLQATARSVDYIKSQLVQSGYEPIEESIGVTVRGNDGAYSFVNIVAELPGTETPTRILELGAHYDTVEGTPGADDNASGVAATLEIARVLSSVRSRKTMRFCFFALEETGRDGSRHHVNQIQTRRERLDGAIIFEMIGYATDQPNTQRTPARIPLLFWPPRTGNFVAVVGNFRSGGLGNRFEAAAASYVPSLPYFSANRLGAWFKDALRSDHKPYWDKGYRAVMLTDTANFRNPNYHRASDTPETLDYAFLRRVTQATAATLLSWSEPLPTTRQSDH